jgi:hypothetical protein
MGLLRNFGFFVGGQVPPLGCGMDLSIGVGRREGPRLVEMDGDVYRFDQAYRCTRKRPMKMLCSAGSYQGHQERAEVRQNVVK